MQFIPDSFSIITCNTSTLVVNCRHCPKIRGVKNHHQNGVGGFSAIRWLQANISNGDGGIATRNENREIAQNLDNLITKGPKLKSIPVSSKQESQL